jgi:chemotaxis methyl-accepting protein methylase
MKPILPQFSSKILEKSAVSPLQCIRDVVIGAGGSNEAGSGLEQLEYQCRRRMQKIGLSTLDSYFEILTTRPSGQAELAKLLQELEHRTSFFSKLPQLEEFRQVVLPQNCRG